MEGSSYFQKTGLGCCTEKRLLKDILKMRSGRTVVLKRNTLGNFTINGRNPEPNETMWWDYENISRTIIEIDDNIHQETAIYKEGDISYLLKFNTVDKTLTSIARYTTYRDFEYLNEVTFDEYNSCLINNYRVTEEQPFSVTFRRNEAGKFTADGKNVVAEWDYIYFDGVTLSGSDINNPMYAYCNVRGIGNIVLTFTRDTSELTCVYNSDHGERVDEFTVYRNSSISRNYKELGPLNMAKVVPYTSIELSSTGLSINGKHETPDRQYMWSINKVNGMEVVLNGTIDVKVPEATPPVTITINAQGKIQKIKDTNGNNRVDVKIPNDDEFLKHLRVSLEISHLSDIKE